MPEPVRQTVGYARASRLPGAGTAGRTVLLALALVGLPVVLWVGAKVYTGYRWAGLTQGMTKAQVDQRLRGFWSYPIPGYQGAEPREAAVRYELLRMGRPFMIQVIFLDEIVADAQPVFDE